MKTHLAGLLLLLSILTAPGAGPLALYPENPQYLLFRGKPTILITSGEHYGAVLNLDFDYTRYLQTLAKDGLNGTRTWAGAYCEPSSAFNIASNTLAPLTGRFICPWARSDQPGYANGGNKFDLNHWDPAYFKRLKDFMTQASRRGVIVELNLFCPFYEESMWQLSPMNAINNINDIGTMARTNVYTLDKNGGLLAVQDAMVRKLVTELNGFDNLYFEICNEPYFGGVTLDWQKHIADVIVDTEKTLKARHLISQNIANDKAKVENPHPPVSIFNFHYATPPDTVGMNYALNKVIGDNETGFRGTNDSVYRMEAWDFIVAGGGLFNNLDYSFVAGREDGTFIYPASQPGGGSPQLRKQLGFLASLMRRLDFIHMRPQNDLVRAELPPGVTARVLGGDSGQYLLYIRSGLGDKNAERKKRFADGELSVTLDIPPGNYAAEWISPATGQTLLRLNLGSGDLHAPAFQDDIAATLKRR